MSRIAIVGMAGRFPGAPDVAALWRVLAEGRETLTVFSEEELRAAGVSPSLLADPAYVRSRGLIDRPDLFDAALFGFNPREADVTDPQHRLLLENAWTALEHAGYDPRRYPGLIGVFAGAGSNTYLLFNLARNREVVDQVGMYQAMLGSDGDFLATRISYKLGLRGPALTVQTACSTSLVAVHLACQSLIHGECDMALAGGVRISVPQRAGYLYQQGGIFSPDGHCRPFDAAAQGSLDGDGVGLVVLKRLDDALADGDHIHGVILGSAINNDGSSKIGYTAPSSEGQAEVISLAQALAGVEASSIGYVEAHGTATPLGDPIEVAALRQVFADVPPESCVLGSVKSNFGHLDAAAGVTSLIKATLALEHGEIPPTVHFERPNPGLGLEDSPFVVSATPMEFPETGESRRAGVSSFGIGGTNAHVVLEEAPEPEGSGPSRSHQLLLLSAATESALEAATVNLAARLPEVDLADAAYTLQVGRRLLSHRRMVVCSDAADAVETLGALDPRRVLTRVEESEDRPVIFLFPGQGAQYPGMAEALFRSEPTFREQIDLCAEVLRAEGIDLLGALYPPGDKGPDAADRLRQTAMAQVSIFAVEHALARLWMEWGVVPAAMIGHSVGEYVAACLAGVFSVEDAVRLVAERGRLMQAMPPGAMLSVPLSEEELRPLLPAGVEIAAVNGPALCVASGPIAAIEELEKKVGDSRRLHTSHAFHSPMMEPVLDRFAAALPALAAPSIPYVSNLTGTWITDAEAVDPRYWVRHLRRTVRFSAGLETLFEQGNAVLLEVGPGRALSSLARRHPGRPGGQTVLSSLPAAPDAGDEDLPVLLRALGQLWLAGVPVDWQGFHAHERRRRVVLPTYPFEGRRHWVEPKEDGAVSIDSRDRTWAPLWKQALPPRPSREEGSWLVLLDGSDIGERLVRLLEARGSQVVAARDPYDYPALLAELPRRIVHFGEAFESLLALARALGERGAGAPLDVAVVSTGLQDVESADEPDPMKALLLGVVLTLPQELPGVTCRSVDVNRRVPAEALLAELEADEPIVALRGAGRWVRSWEPVILDPGPPPLRERGVYLITGGSGGVGLEIARFLARTVRARLVLVSRSSVNQDRIAELEALGAEVLAVAADVTRRDAMASALSSARERFGEVHGVIHAAGVPGSGVMQLTAAETAAGVLAPKVKGTIILDELLRDSEADFLVLCSSLSAVLGGPGQADYAAANAFLDAFARSRALSSGPRVIAIDWDTWLGIGMAGMAAPATKPQPAVSDPQPLAHPLLQQRTMGDREDVFLSRFRTGETWVLDEHRLGGHPIVPGTTWLEMAGAAFREAAGNGHGFEMRDVMFVAPLRVGDGETKEVRTVLRRESDAFGFSVASDGQEHALGTILSLHSAPASVDLGGLQNAAHTATVLGEEYREDLRTAGLGPRWESLRKVWVGDGYALGYLELAPELGGDVERFGLHPALMDIATSFGESHLPAGAKGEGHYLPLSYKRLLAHGPLPRKAWSWVRFGKPSPETLSFDVTILDEQGTERVRVEEFVLKRLDVAQTMRARSETRPTITAEPEEGLTGAEAVELLRRILAGPRLPQVAVSALPLPQVIASRRRLARDLAEGKVISGGGHARPDVATAYVAPRNELEARLAAIWQEILGIEPVGAFDDFFELGGHSLLGTQLVSRLRSELKVELPLARLFEAPVLADLAAAIGGAGIAGRVREEAIPVVPRGDGLPLSFAQERLWFLDQLDPGNPFYNVSQAVRMEGALDLGRLFASLDGIVRRHEVLRTAFTSVHGRPVQRVLPEAKPILLLADLSGLPEAAREAEARGLLARAAEVAFDLTRPPLFATTLFRLAPDHHVCVLTLHHIVSDGWSIGVLISELAALYRSFALDQPPLLAPLPVQYADFAHWQRNALEQETAERQVAYWRRQLAGPLPVLELPTDHPRPAVQTFRGAAEHLALPAQLTAQLKALCNREGATPFMGLLASFALLLHGAGGQTDVLIGTPIAGRNRKEVEGLIGVFLNTLVLRVDLAGAPGFRELLKRIRAMVLAAYSNQDVPIEKLLQEIRPDRDLSRASLFQVFFNMQDFPRRELELPGLTLTSLPIREVPAKFDLTVYAAEVDGEILFELIYNADLFDRRTAVGLLARFQALIESAVAGPDTTIGVLTAPKELPGVGPEHAFPERCLHRLFEAQAARTPDATALVCGEGTLSYGELDARADRVARFLRQRGVGPERRVAASFGRSLDLAVAILGILKAGGAYVAVDPEQPVARRDRILADARPDLVLGPGPLPGVDGEGVEDSGVLPENLAWITYTSGSTGVPKGIQAPHRGAVNYLTWVAGLVDLGPADVVLQVAAPTFDASVRDLIGPLLVGATVVLLPEGTRDPAPALEAIRRHRVTAVLSAVPTLLRSWLAASPSSPITDFSSLTRLLVSGEMLYLADRDRAREVFGPQLEVINHYGPTECTMTTTFALLSGVASGEGPAPVGRPVGNARVVLVDGEVHIAGAGLTRGYWDRPELTAEAFVPDPSDPDGGGRLYRTGDLGRFLPDGSLEVLGRRDLQVKIRGNRVELGEVESVLASHPGVRAAAAAVRDERLIAWVVPRSGRPGQDPGAAELRRFLAERLPEYMLPQAFVALETLPLTHTGKLDRTALPAPPAQEDRAGEALRPLTPLEEIVSAVFCELLGLGRVGPEESFFELGGHSLLAIQVVARFRETLGVEVPVRRLFETPTVAGLARQIEQEMRSGLAAPPLLEPTPREGRLPLSFAQERLWVLDRLTPGSAAWHMPVSLRLTGNLDPRVLEAGLTDVVRRHAALRAVFSEEDGVPFQVTAPASPFVLPIIDLRGLTAAAARTETERRTDEEARRPFDLGTGRQGPLLRALLLRLDADDWRLLLVMHHIASDGWSLGVLVRETAALYGAFRDGRPSPLPEPPVQYADYASWQRGWLSGEALAEQLAWWRRELDGAPAVLELPADRPRPPVQSDRGAREPLSLAGLADGVAALARREGATPFMVLLAAFQALLSRLTGQDDLLVGTPVANRTRVELEGLIGFFVNTLVLRGRPGAETFRGFLAQVRAAALGAFAHQDLPFDRLVEELAVERSLSRHPLIQVMLALQVPTIPANTALDLPDLALEPSRVDIGTSQLDLSLDLDAGLRGTVEYSVDLFDRPRIVRLASHLETLLAAALADPDRPVRELPLLAADEESQLLAWSGGAAVRPAGLVPDLVRARAAESPDAEAVAAADGVLTYGALVARSGRLAGRLRRLGIGGMHTEEAVGVLLERSAGAVAALLGILEAGAVYLPLDPAYPAARLAGMLADAGARFVVTTRGMAHGMINRLPAGIEPVWLEDDDGGEEVRVPLHPQQAAYVIYTSGSTGRPKGVTVSHGAIAAHCASWIGLYRLGPGDRILQFAAPGFDASIEQVLPALAAGATVVPRGAELWLPADFLRHCRELGLTAADLPTAWCARWIQEAADLEEPAPAGLRLVSVGGEEMPAEAARRWSRTPLAGVPLFNAYGPTEAVISATGGEVPDGEAGPVPIGRPIAGHTARVLDRGGRPAPVGVPGELCLGGLLARGYLGRPAETAERFVPDPWAEEPGARLYRTGDLASWREDGTLRFLGRIDHQIKIRGVRIEPGEVEAALLALPGVREAAVALADGRLVAWLGVGMAGQIAEPAAIRGLLGGRLPEAMIPSEIVLLDALPVTPNSKVDRKALPAPSRRQRGGRGEPPRTPVEEILAGIWSELLGVERVSRDLGFFAAGGHSLLATQAISQVRRRLGVELPLRALFEAPTPAELAARVEAALAGHAGATPPLVPVRHTGPLPLSFPQERLWFLDRLEPGSSTYHITGALGLRGDLDVPALNRAVDEMVRRHESLRTTFAEGEDGRPVQRVKPDLAISLPVIDLRGLDGPGLSSQWERRLEDVVRQPFDLGRGPLLRIALMRLGDRDWRLALAMHHIVSDGWSMEVFTRDLTALYSAFANGLPSPLPGLPVQYGDHAVWQRQWLSREVRETLVSFWRTRLAGVQRLRLPTDRPRPSVPGSRAGHALAILPAELVQALETLGRGQGATLFMTLLAGLQIVLGRHAAQTDFAIGTPVANRDRSEVQELIGLFLNTLALRAELEGNPSFEQLLARVRAATLEAFAHQALPFEIILEELQPERRLDRTPLFDVLFNFLRFGSGDRHTVAHGLEIEDLATAEPAAKLDLTLYAIPDGERLRLAAVFRSDLFDGSTVERLLAHLGRLLAAAAERPGTPLSALPLLGEAEREQLARAGNRIGPRNGFTPWTDAGTSIPARFALQAALHPEAPAVVSRGHRGHRWSYAELDRRSDRIAGAILERCGPGEGRVALLFDHDAPMPAAVLGALKAGKTYVPLDPSYPPERLAYMLEDSQSGLLLVRAGLEEAADRLADNRLPVLVVGGGGDEDGPSEPIRVEVAPETPAYILYTSGSTGRPKGVVQSHRNALHHCRAYSHALRLHAGDRLSLLASYSFDAAVMDIFGALLNGAALCLLDLKSAGLAAVPAWLAEQAITVYHSTPTVFRYVAAALDGQTAPSSLRLAVLGGEAATRHDLELFRRAFPPGCLLVNGLGPTESTLALQLFADAETRVSGATMPVGYPVEGTAVDLVDERGEPVDVLAPGEIVIRSPYVALGYWRQPELTAAAFHDEPGGGRSYRTGDLGRRLLDGSLEFLGRRDHQVKIRGQRVEIEEIEATLARCPGVVSAAVAAVAAIAGGEGDGELRLVGYCVPRPGEELAPERLRAFARESLPEAMVPAAFVILPELPLTPTRKVDRAALPAPDLALVMDTAGFVAPRTPAEEVLAAIWREVLKLDRVGVETGFFDLGGHSLLAMQVISRVRSAFGVDLPLRALFEAPTVAGLAARLDEARGADRSDIPPLEPTGADRGPLSFTQERLWFLDRLEPGSAAYHIPAAMRITGDLDAEVLARTFAEIVRRHDVLRTTFAEDENPVQVVAPELPLPLETVDLRGLSSEADRRLTEEVRRPFDLVRGPLVRALLLRLDEAEWILAVVTHHIVSDGWSMGVMIRETAELYTAFRQGLPSPLPGLPVQYLDYAVWQRSWLQGEALEAQLAWWRKELEGAPAVLELPADRPRPAVRSPRGGSARIFLPPELTRSLADLARREGATPFMLLMAAFQTLLHRTGGQDDVLVGTPVANRSRVELEGLIGFFANTLVLRGRFGGESLTFRRLLERTRSSALGAFAHQDLPFERLVEELAVERSLSHNPLFQAAMALQNLPARGLELPGAVLEQQPFDAGAVKFDLDLAWTEEAGRLEGTLSYAADLFDAPTALRLLGQLRTLLEGIAAEPGARIADLPLLGEAERHQVLVEWHDTAVAAEDSTLHGLIEAQATRTPDSVAVAFAGTSITYRELDLRADALARRLRALGVGPEARVGICAERSLELVVGLLGILKAGGAYVPLDPGYPDGRLAVLLEDAKAGVVLVQADLQERLRSLAPEESRLVDLGETAAEGDGRVESRVSPDNAAYVIFTSGSTGRPKGAVNTHRAIVNRLLWMQKAYGLTPADRVLQKTPFSFDVSVWEFFWPLLSGARLVVARPGEHQDAAELVRTIAREEVTHIHFVPSMLRAFLEEPELERCRGLRRVITSGEALPLDLARDFHAGLGRPFGVELHNLYGPTEAAVDVTYHACLPDEERVPIGRPVDGVRLRILDRDGGLVPPGVAGEPGLGGAQLARGYVGRPDLTAERFVPDPFGEPGARLYRTGDLARYLPDGEVEYLGRIDNQVKLRGFRIELGEIEAALSGHPEVREAVVLARPAQGSAGPRLVACVSLRGPQDLDALREHLARSLPAWMVPSDWVVLDSLPLTPNGKVDRKALERMAPTASDTAAGEPPAGPVEELVAGIWAGLLGREAVSRGDDFFALGGHSLLATRVISRVRRALGVEIPLRLLFEAPTLAGFARAVESARRSALPGVEPLVPLPPEVRGSGLPLSFAQERLWFLDRLLPKSPLYNVPTALRARGDLDVTVFAAAVRQVAGRHEILRTAYGAEDGRPVQRIASELSIPVPGIDLRGLSPEVRETEARRLATEEARRPFDLGTGPLLRVVLVRTADAERLVLATFHHIVADGWSLDVFVRDLAAFYQGEALPPLPVQYADYAAWQRRRLSGESLKAELEHWRQALAGAPAVLELPADKPRPAVLTYRGGREDFRLSAELAGRAAALGRRHDATPFMVLLAVFDILLARLTGREDLVIGTPVANRDRMETEGLVGFFMNTLALRTSLAGEPGLAGLLPRVRETALAAYAHQELPFEKLVEELKPARDLAHAPLVQVTFTLVSSGARASLPGVVLEPAFDDAPGTGTARFDLTLNLEGLGDGLAGSLEHNRDLFEPATVRRLAAHFANLLGGALADPERSLWELPLLSEEEREQLLGEWNDTAEPLPALPAETAVHRWIEEQARSRPGAVALEHADRRLTYAELDGQAGRLARRLRALGVGPERCVGLCVERSAEMVVALLAVMKTGGAWLPLDPAHPRERLARILEDAGRPLMIASRSERSTELAEIAADVLWLDEDGEAPDGPEPDALLDADGLAYVIFTSGSTGRPKGVQVVRRGLANFLAAMRRRPGLGPDDVLVAVTTLSFDISGLELLLPLTVGARVVVAGREAVADGLRLAALLTRSGATAMQATPATWRLLLESGWEAPAGFKVLCGGEALPGELAARLGTRGAEVWNLYGPTETTIWSAVEPVDLGTAADRAVVPLGRPLANTTIHLAGRGLELVPAGVPGELLIGGAGLARGYLGRPDLTAERFVPDPWGPPGSRVYRTGDLARRLPDGRVEFLGRLDHQVKIRGYRIELGEIEAALAEHPAVRHAVVVDLPDPAGGRRLVAYAEVAGAGPGLDELRAFLRARLPEYMLPAAFVPLERLPLNPSGKVDRRALPDPSPERPALAVEFVAPREGREAALAALWCEALGVERVGIHDNFFDLGGHSLLLMRLQARIAAEIGIDLPVLELFEHPTVASLARRLDELGAGRTERPEETAVDERTEELRRGRERRARRAARRASDVEI